MSRWSLAHPLSIGQIRSGDWASSVPDLLVAEGRLGVPIGEPSEHARLSAIDGEALRVYVSRKLIVVHTDIDEPDAIEVAPRKVRQETRRPTVKVVIGRDTAGKIVAEDRLHGQQLFWITFDPACSAPACAFAFVQNTLEPRSYDRTRPPALAGHDGRASYYGRFAGRHRLVGARLRSLAEPNEVMARKRKLL